MFQYELKETGHTPELTSEQEGREVLMKTQTAANKKPQLRKSPSQEPDSERRYTEGGQVLIFLLDLIWDHLLFLDYLFLFVK